MAFGSSKAPGRPRRSSVLRRSSSYSRSPAKPSTPRSSIPRRNEAQRLARFPARKRGVRGRDSSLSDCQRAVSAVRGSVRDRWRRGLFRPQRLCARPSDRRLGGGQAVAQSRRVSGPALDAHHPALCRRAGRHCGADRQPDDRRFCPLSLLRREPLFLRQPRRFLSCRLEPGGRGMVLCAVCSRPVPGRKAAWETRPAVRGDLRGPGHSRRGGAAVLDRAARLGLERPAGHAVSYRLDRLGLFALSYARAAFADWARRRLRPMAPYRAARAACDIDPDRARRRDPGRRWRSVGPAGVSIRLGGVRHDLGRRRLASRGPFPQSCRQRRELLSRPHLVLGLSLPPPRSSWR